MHAGSVRSSHLTPSLLLVNKLVVVTRPKVLGRTAELVHQLWNLIQPPHDLHSSGAESSLISRVMSMTPCRARDFFGLKFSWRLGTLQLQLLLFDVLILYSSPHDFLLLLL